MRTIWLIYSQNDTEVPDLVSVCQSSDRAQQIITKLLNAGGGSSDAYTVHFAKNGLEGYIIRVSDDVLVYRAYAESRFLLED